MTILVASASSEAIALATESRTTQRRGKHHRVTSDSARKVFEISGRFGVATYGAAMIGRKTVAGLLDEWAAENTDTSLQEVGNSLGAFFQQQLDTVTPPSRRDLTALLPRSWPLGFVIAGYGSAGVGNVLDVQVDAKTFEVVDTEVSTVAPNVLFRGQTSPLRRLIFGVDVEEIRRAGIAISDDLRERLPALEYELIEPMTAQDAVDLAFFLVETTVRMQRFNDGTASQRAAGDDQIPGCGGPIQGLVVNPRGVEWISQSCVVAPQRSVREGTSLD